MMRCFLITYNSNVYFYNDIDATESSCNTKMFYDNENINCHQPASTNVLLR